MGWGFPTPITGVGGLWVKRPSAPHALWDPRLTPRLCIYPGWGVGVEPGDLGPVPAPTPSSSMLGCISFAGLTGNGFLGPRDIG